MKWLHREPSGKCKTNHSECQYRVITEPKPYTSNVLCRHGWTGIKSIGFWFHSSLFCVFVLFLYIYIRVWCAWICIWISTCVQVHVPLFVHMHKHRGLRLTSSVFPNPSPSCLWRQRPLLKAEFVILATLESSFVFCWCDEHHGQKQLEKVWVYLAYTI